MQDSLKVILRIIFFSFLGFCISGKFRCRGKKNEIPLYTAEPVFKKKVKNGKLYEFGDPSKNSSMNILHLYGSDYDMGYALGELMENELNDFISTTLVDYIDFLVESLFPSFPSWVQDFIEKYGVNLFLDLIHSLTHHYTPEYFYEYMRGISDSSHVDYKTLRRINLITQFTKAHPMCTLVGAWNSATSNGKLLQIRALDMGPPDNVTPLFQYATITVHHYENSNDNDVININSIGYVGAISGVGRSKDNNIMALSEKFWATKENPFIPKSGKVWNFHLFDMLRKGKNLSDSISILKDSKRTCSIHVGIGSDFENEFRMIYYNSNSFSIINWNDQHCFPEHPRMKYVVYLDKHNEDTKDYCLSDILMNYYGNYTAEIFFREVIPLSETGNAQAIVYDYSTREIYYAYGYKNKGYQQQFVKLNMQNLFNEKM